MRYFFLLLLVIVAVWYFFIRTDASPAAGMHTVKMPPEQQIQSLLSLGSVDASQLASLCTSYPELCARYLRGKQINIQGTVAEVRTSGMEGRRGDMILSGSSSRKIVLVCDLDQYSGPGVNFRYIGKFQALGTELLYLVQRNGSLLKKVVVTQGASVTQFCALKNMGATLVEFQMVNGPLWAGAETKQ